MRILFLIFLSLFAFGKLLKAQTNIVIPASKDNTIYSDNTGNSNGAGPNFTSGAILSNPVRRGLIKFDLSAIPPGATITAASLTLSMNRTISGAANVSLHRLAEDWGEGASDAGAGADGMGVPAQAGDATWPCSFSNGLGGCNTAWGTSGGVFNPLPSATTSVSGLGTYVWNSAQMITDVQNMLNNAAANFGWMIIGDEAAPGSAKRYASRTSPNIPDRPFLSVTYTAVLPISLVYFKARAQNRSTLLSWKTAQESNNDFFEIEFSTDAVNFTAIGRLKGAGNSSIPSLYSFVHHTNQTGKVLYRLSQVDFNGHRAYSQVEVAELKNIRNSLIIAPNPVSDKLVIPGFVIDGKQRYVIINLKGEKIAEAGLLKPEIILPAKITAGMYHLRIIQNNGSILSAGFIKY